MEISEMNLLRMYKLLDDDDKETAVNFLKILIDVSEEFKEKEKHTNLKLLK